MFKVAILGPESTGKSALAEALANHYNTAWAPEYAREYVEKLTVPYTFNDVCNIAHKQIEQEKYYNNPSFDNKNFVFFDTELIITKVWLEYKFNTVPHFITERIKEGYFDVYLLCAPDLAWIPDAVREHGTDREFFFNWYKKEIEDTGKPYYIIEGFGKERTENAINALTLTIENHE
jgi:NadR type nicotinamide-nucleotide adenylyltransferase